MDLANASRIPFSKIDFQLLGNLTEDNIISDTVQLPVKNHYFVDVSSDDLYQVGGDRMKACILTYNLLTK